jgi:hypothetical protein
MPTPPDPSGAPWTILRVYYCTANISPRCRGSWGRADLPPEPGGTCFACQRVESANAGVRLLPAALHHPAADPATVASLAGAHLDPTGLALVGHVIGASVLEALDDRPRD